MNMTDGMKTPIWFWIFGIIALLWNALGVFSYFQEVMMSAEQFAAMSQEQQDLQSMKPFWVSAAFAIAVFAGLAASVALLMRKAIAVRLFLLSLLGVLVQVSSYVIIDRYREFMSEQGWTMPIVISVLGLAFLLISRQAEKIGILR